MKTDGATHSFLTKKELDAGLTEIMESPSDRGFLEMIVRRPAVDERETLASGTLDMVEGLAGDSWKRRPSSRSDDGLAHPDMQITLMNSRVIDLIAQDKSRWALAGDQLYVDFDLRESNVPATTRLAVGSAVIEVTEQPHTGCAKFVERFGKPAMKFINSSLGRELRLRGIYARVVRSGRVRVGDVIRKI